MTSDANAQRFIHATDFRRKLRTFLFTSAVNEIFVISNLFFYTNNIQHIFIKLIIELICIIFLLYSHVGSLGH